MYLFRPSYYRDITATRWRKRREATVTDSIDTSARIKKYNLDLGYFFTIVQQINNQKQYREIT